MSERRLTNSERAEKAAEGFDQIEAQRSARLKQAKTDQQTRQLSLERERERLTKKYGPNHKRVVKIDRELATQPTFIKAVDEQAVRSETKPATPRPTYWTVYGTIRDKENNRLGGLTVSLFDAGGHWVKDLGFACSDDKGFYSLKVDDPDGRLTKKYKGKPLYLTLTDDQKAVLHKDEEALFLSTGTSENREIVIVNPCGTPPEEPGGAEPKYLVEGTITDRKGKPLPGLTVKAVDQDFTGENPLGEAAVTDEKGYYRIPYRADDFILEGKETGGADIILYIYDESGELIHTSEPSRNAPKVHRIDLKIKR